MHGGREKSKCSKEQFVLTFIFPSSEQAKLKG